MLTLFERSHAGRGTQYLPPLDTPEYAPAESLRRKQELRPVSYTHLLFERARAECASGSAQMLILDEALSATYLGAFSQNELCELVRSRRPGLEIVLTGRGAGDELIAVCDYVTEMRMLRHPMDQGIAARRGIEY